MREPGAGVVAASRTGDAARVTVPCEAAGEAGGTEAGPEPQAVTAAMARKHAAAAFTATPSRRQRVT